MISSKLIKRGITSLSKALLTTSTVLNDKITLITTLSHTDYTTTCPIVKASVGQHCRHSLHHINLALSPLLGVSSGTLDYDERVRGDLIETSRDYAISSIKKIRDRINDASQTADGSSKVSVTFALSPSGTDFVPFESTLEREVAFAAHHALHHMAMMKLTAEGTLRKTVPEGFGLAPGTRRYMESQKRFLSTRSMSTRLMSDKAERGGEMVGGWHGGGRGSVPMLTYYSAWFCPFAHRCTLALEHHRGHVRYEWVESLGWEKRDNQDGEVGNGKDWFYHWKSEDLMEVRVASVAVELPNVALYDKLKAESEASCIMR